MPKQDRVLSVIEAAVMLLESYRTTGSGLVGATFQPVAAKFGAGRSGGIRNATLISLMSSERQARPYIAVTIAQLFG
jgi:hypothetical protein